MLRYALIVLFGAIPATLFGVLAAMATVVGGLEFYHDPSLLELVLVLAGAFGVWGALSLWRAVYGVPVVKLRLGLAAGIASALTFQFLVFHFDDGSIPIRYVLWSALPVITAIGLLIESYLKRVAKSGA